MVEIDLSRSSLGTLDLFFAMGVGEVWRWTRQGLSIQVLGAGGYTEVSASQLLPLASAQAVSDLVVKYSQMSRPDWNQALRTWLACHTDIGVNMLGL